MAADADLFVAIRSGKVSVVTDEIETFTEKGIRLKSGDLLQADIIVTATGLKLKSLGGMQAMVDGTPINLAGRISYKGMMLRGVPNFSFTLGYSNASWTLKCNLVAEYICRLLNHMSAHGYDYATPVGDEPAIVDTPAINLTSGYIKQGDRVSSQTGGQEAVEVSPELRPGYARPQVQRRRRRHNGVSSSPQRAAEGFRREWSTMPRMI